MPVKFSLQDANGAYITDLGSFVALTSAPCDGSEPGTMAETAGRSKLRSTANQFVFNWQTSKSWTGCRVLQLMLDDGTEHVALFQFE